MPFSEPDEAGGRLYPREIIGHLLLVWPVAHIADAPSKYSKPGKPSDAIQVDVVDLDQVDPSTGEPGLLVYGTWWRPSKLIQSLRNRVGSPDPMLAWMQMGTANPGMNAPYVLTSATKDPEAVRRATEWMMRNPDFVPTSVQDGSVTDGEPSVVEEDQPAREPTVLERLAKMSQQGADRLPKPPSEPVPF
jgi:hypothetical protein